MIQYKRINHPRYKYELTKEYTISINGIYPEFPHNLYFVLTKSDLTIHKGYAWDGCTGAPDLKSAMRASLTHDVFYQCFREGWLDPDYHRKYTDDLFRLIMIEDGASRFIARTYWMAVRLFGRWSSKADPRRMNP